MSDDSEFDIPKPEAPNNENFEDFVETLSQFDADGKGMVKAAELRHILTAMGQPLTDTEVDQVFAGQVNNDGQINIAEFVRHVLEI